MIQQTINQRRRQILIHSELYYGQDVSIIDDATFDRWARELADLQKEHPETAAKVPFADVFQGFDGTTGFDLVGKVPWARSKANQILLEHRRRTS